MSLITPINRYTKKIDDKTYHITPKGFPQHYKDSEGSFYDIDFSYTQSQNNDNIGDFILKPKNTYSLGIRKDNNTYKYVGIRPDETQESGSHQFEFSFLSASVNSNDIAIDLSKNEFIDDNNINLGNVHLYSDNNNFRQMLHYTSSIDDFKISYKLHLKGFDIINDKYSENSTIRNSISCSLIDCGNVSGSQFSSMLNLQTHSESILSMYFTDDTVIKNPNFNPNPYYNYEMMSGSEFVGDTGSFYMIDRDDTFYDADSNWDNMSSGYLKDNLFIRFKDYNLGEKVKDCILDSIGASMDNSYIRINGGKKVGFFGGPPNKNMAFMLLSLKDITHMSSSYRYKNFDDFSHITMSYSDIINKVKTKLKTYEEVNVTTDYYKPREGVFNIRNNNDNSYFKIASPLVLDSNLNVVASDTMHTLKDNGDNTYEYTKYPSDSLLLKGITGSADYIDVDIDFGQKAGLYTSSKGYGPSSGPTTPGLWNNIRNELTGSNFSVASGLVNYAGARITFEAGKHARWRWDIYRMFFDFDTSDITEDVSSATLDWRWYSGATDVAATIIATEWTPHSIDDSATTTDYSKTGSVIYSEGTGSGYWSGWADPDSKPFNSNARNVIKAEDEFNICLREYNHDYTGLDPSGSANPYNAVDGIITMLNFGSSYKTVLVVTIADAPPPTKWILKGGETTILGGSLLIK